MKIGERYYHPGGRILEITEITKYKCDQICKVLYDKVNWYPIGEEDNWGKLGPSWKLMKNQNKPNES
jgi:hypothetical protein